MPRSDRKKDGEHPTAKSVKDAIASFDEEKQKRGRKEGWRKTTKEEDKIILQTFKKLRPPGLQTLVTSACFHFEMPVCARA